MTGKGQMLATMLCWGCAATRSLSDGRCGLSFRHPSSYAATQSLQSRDARALNNLTLPESGHAAKPLGLHAIAPSREYVSWLGATGEPLRLNPYFHIPSAYKCLVG